MSVIGSIIIGFIVGLIARALMPGRDPLGCLFTTLLGMGGALVGRYLGQLLGLYREDQPAGFLMSIVGAMIILYLFHHFRKDQPKP